ncbi:MAG: hypothetical protein DI527_13450 [Chelatococcus sp.]|nr:MAG: hypothetical protein DI527_13450 [Chelatococcus sp.]
MPRIPLILPLALALSLQAADAGAQQEGELVRAPVPPQRPFDLDLGAPPMPPIVVPAPSVAASPPPAPPPAPPFQTASATQAPEVAPETPLATDPDEDEGAEWPKLTPGQKAGAEPDFDPNEKPERPGISTDPGTSIACLPPRLKTILEQIAEKYGAVKVTSTWRPPWRARRASYHLRCEAMDFRVPGKPPRAVLEWVRAAVPEAGGHKVYWNGLIHIDTGPRRAW